MIAFPNEKIRFLSIGLLKLYSSTEIFQICSYRIKATQATICVDLISKEANFLHSTLKHLQTPGNFIKQEELT